MAQEDHLRQLRGTTPAITAIMAAYAGYRGDPEAGARVLEALDALERDALAAEKRLMELIFADLDRARARISGTGSAAEGPRAGANRREKARPGHRLNRGKMDRMDT